MKASIKETRSAYETAKKLYHATGRKALGKPESSKEKKAYKSAKRAYKTVGKALGKLTGLK